MSEHTPGNAGRAEPGLFPEQGTPPSPQQRAEPDMHADPAPPADVPSFSARPEVPQFNAGPEVPRFAAPPERVAPPSADDELPPFGARLPLEPPPPARWGSRLALLGVGIVGLGGLAGGLLWFDGQRNVDRSFEVLAMSSRAPQAVVPVPAPVPAPAPAPVQQSVPEPVPPLVTLPPEEVGPRPPQSATPAQVATPAVSKAVAKPVKKVAAGAPARNVRKAVAKPGTKAVAKTAAKKKTTAAARKAARKTGAGQRTALAPRPVPRVPVQQRRCKRGELARECLGLKG